MKSIAALSLLAAPALVYATLDADIKTKGKAYFGTALDPNTISDSAVNAVARAEFGCYTPENSAKWESIHPSNATYSWTNFDTLVSFAQTNGKAVRGHTLVWHSQLPQWVKDITDVNVLTATIQAHVTAVVGRYKGKILHWDVANEVIDDSGNLRTSVFSTVFGGDTFLDVAFKAARAADPNAKLYLNDYNLDYSGAKLTNFIALVKKLQARGVPIDGIGSQAHLIAGNVASFTSAFNQLIAVGLDVAITELDIRILKPVTTALLTQQQTDYNTITKACIAQAKCVGITVWGVSDKNSWVDSTFPTYDSPLLYDDNVAKKPAYTGVESAIDVTTTTSTTTTTTTTTTSSGTGGCTVAKWGQCGGQTYTGCTTCASGSTCTYSNAFYSQCL